MREARIAYDLTKQRLKEVEEHPSDKAAVQEAVLAHSAAFDRYRRAVLCFSRLVVDGKLKDE